MSSLAGFSRDELLKDLGLLRDDPEFLSSRDAYLKHAVQSLDVELIEGLLQAGANANQSESWGDDLLRHLAHEYAVTRSTKGPLVLRVIELLLVHGADPNHVGAGNWRALDHCIEENEDVLVRLFVKYGADPRQREHL